jgi:SAM-dependent methyltransferase
MHEILRHLPRGALVLDLGSQAGSFDAALYPLRTVRLDIQAPAGTPLVPFVRADAARLPFASASFDAIVSNHSLEHFGELEQALRELGRVVKPNGSIYVAVPDSTTLADRLYRWVGRGGGHVNEFSSREALIVRVEQYSKLRFAAARPLMTSLSVFNRGSLIGRVPRKLALLGGGNESVLLAWSAFSRLLDRCFHTRLSFYGWVLYFGALHEDLDWRPWSNVCVRCGCGASSEWLESNGLVQRSWLFIRGYTCQSCGAWNVFTSDEGFAFLGRVSR